MNDESHFFKIVSAAQFYAICESLRAPYAPLDESAPEFDILYANQEDLENRLETAIPQWGTKVGLGEGVEISYGPIANKLVVLWARAHAFSLSLVRNLRRFLQEQESDFGISVSLTGGTITRRLLVFADRIFVEDTLLTAFEEIKEANCDGFRDLIELARGQR